MGHVASAPSSGAAAALEASTCGRAGWRAAAALGGGRPTPAALVGVRRMAWKGCAWLEQDIVRLRTDIARRREEYLEGKRRFRRGGNFSSEEQRLARRRFGDERSAMKLEERKLKELEAGLGELIRKHRRHCGG
eukprot:TRINITY_DN52131_c0_g1_i1.p2 TRINITY_DN52131_c0_g1~~TRINITY_DN52131_c0_g1_i1.p2  ORF type:complete len:148 (-),score=37.57 TRINITY_DN52131_c0_g1_i1:161-562(-)